MKFYLMRHGKTYFNKYDRMQGWSDTPLIPEGEQAIKQIKIDVNIAKIFTSDLGRTIQTAKILQENNPSLAKLSITPCMELRESFFGSFEGMENKIVWQSVCDALGYQNMQQMAKANVPLEAISDTLKKLDPYKEVETYQEVIDRVTKKLRSIYEGSKDKDENILIVTHGNTIRHLLHYIDNNFKTHSDINNGTITIINYDGNQFILEAFNLLASC